MTIYEQINKDLMIARKAKNKEDILILSTLKGELGRKCDGKPETLSDKDIVSTIKKTISTIEDNMNISNDMSHEREIVILNTYVPKQMTHEEIESIINSSMSKLHDTGGPGKSYFGSIMKDLKPFSDRIDMKYASTIIKEKLENV